MPGARRFTISGRVQGVYFRAGTREVARRLGIAGHAMNLANGEVEVLACGDEAALAELRAWLQHGPRGAVVDKIVEEAVESGPLAGFRTG